METTINDHLPAPGPPAVLSRKRADLLRFAVVLGALLLLNFLGQRLFFRLDLTEERADTFEWMLTPVMEQPSCLRRDLPLI